jgi:hypothetical protein
MVGESSGHREASPSKGIEGKASHGRNVGDGNGKTRAGNGSGDPKSTVERAGALGRLNSAQTKALSDLLSRTSVLGFESRRLISVMVSNIALEDSTTKRTELALQLREYLEGDGLAKDLVPVLSGAFKLK